MIVTPKCRSPKKLGRWHANVEALRKRRPKSVTDHDLPRKARYSQPRKSLPFGFWAQMPRAHPATTGSRPGPCHYVFLKGTRLKKQHPKASFVQTIASQTRGHSAICSCKKLYPIYQTEPSISQTRHRHTHQRSIPSSNHVQPAAGAFKSDAARHSAI